MSNKKSNFNLGNISGNATVNQADGNITQAGGDVVGHDKITTTDNSTVYNGFKKEADKEQFVTELEGLRTLLRSVKSEIETVDGLDGDQRDEISLELMQQIKALKEVREQAVALPTGQQATPEQTSSLSHCLESTGQLMSKAQSFGEKLAELNLKVTPLIEKVAPALGVLKSLFGI
jgi:hypothetical protein